MNTYYLKVYAVIPGAPRYEYECDGDTEYFTNEQSAEIYLDWWKGDQGRKDSEIVETEVSCAVVDGIVIVPTNITR